MSIDDLIKQDSERIERELEAKFGKHWGMGLLLSGVKRLTSREPLPPNVEDTFTTMSIDDLIKQDSERMERELEAAFGEDWGAALMREGIKHLTSREPLPPNMGDTVRPAQPFTPRTQ